MYVEMDDGELKPLDERLEEYGFTPEYSRLINRLLDKGVLTEEDVWYITSEYWRLRNEN